MLLKTKVWPSFSVKDQIVILGFVDHLHGVCHTVVFFENLTTTLSLQAVKKKNQTAGHSLPAPVTDFPPFLLL